MLRQLIMHNCIFAPDWNSGPSDYAQIPTKTDYETCLQLCDDIKGNPPPVDGHIYGIKRLRTSSDSA